MFLLTYIHNNQKEEQKNISYQILHQYKDIIFGIKLTKLSIAKIVIYLTTVLAYIPK